ncbi:MAG: VOC family protein [Roseitalea sp.]|nr:VOC family protein [Roseitalea sp.]MBO6953210.1 VOC family protein [Rhizobiaceae bacterium]MBO6593557.1 VOC family protein [Roseitalea sp.]MBO6600953.1 VOC family protein [Roseitalea sp.]MBO6612634.1 VOC family protein [Roseitalea sp.]
MTAHGHFHWNELMSRDVEKAKAFYADVLGWSFESMKMGPTGTYWIAIQDGERVAGMYEMAGDSFDGMPEAWYPYIAVDDVDERVERAKAAGATVLGEPFDVPQLGRIAMVRQPGGALMGWIAPADDPPA